MGSGPSSKVSATYFSVRGASGAETAAEGAGINMIWIRNAKERDPPQDDGKQADGLLEFHRLQEPPGRLHILII